MQNMADKKCLLPQSLSDDAWTECSKHNWSNDNRNQIPSGVQSTTMHCVLCLKSHFFGENLAWCQFCPTFICHDCYCLRGGVNIRGVSPLGLICIEVSSALHSHPALFYESFKAAINQISQLNCELILSNASQSSSVVQTNIDQPNQDIGIHRFNNIFNQSKSSDDQSRNIQQTSGLNQSNIGNNNASKLLKDNQPNKDKQPSYILATQQTNESRVCLIPKDIADMNQFCSHVLAAACLVGRTPVVDMLLRSGYTDGSENDSRPLTFAASNGHVDCVKTLFEIGQPDVTSNDQAPLRLASSSGHISVVRELINCPGTKPNVKESYAIRLAAANGHANVVELLIADGRAEPEAIFNDALQMAAFYGHTPVVKILVKDTRVSTCPKGCVEAMQSAAMLGFPAIVKCLLQNSMQCRDSAAVMHAATRAVNESTQVLEELWTACPKAFMSIGERLQGSIGLSLRPHWLHSIRLFLMAHDRRVGAFRTESDGRVALTFLPGDILREICDWCSLPVVASKRSILDDMPSF